MFLLRPFPLLFHWNISVDMGPFKCYVTQMGVVTFSRKKCYEGVWSNVISVTRGWVGVKFPGKKRYVTLDWPLTLSSSHFKIVQLSGNDKMKNKTATESWTILKSELDSDCYL